MKKRVYPLILALALLSALLLLIALPASAETYSGTCGAEGDGSNLTWTFDSETEVLTISGHGAMTDYTWSNKAPWDNYHLSITAVSLPDGLTCIGNYAFYGCRSLTSVTVPANVTSIGDRSFYGCNSLTSVTVPANVTSIGNTAFSNCISLTEINVAPGNSYYVSVNGVLFNNAKTELIQYPAGKTETIYKIPASVTAIGLDAFNYCIALVDVTIPNSVTSIGETAFVNCISLASITIPNSLTSIGESAFWGCRSLTSVTIGNSVTSIGNYAFHGCSSLTSVTIPDSVTWIGIELFRECDALTNVTIGNGVTRICDYTFFECRSLTSVTIGNSVTSIGNYVFYGCSSLTSVTIHDSVTSIGNYAFYGCSSLTSVTIDNSVTSIGNYAFYGCSSLTSVTIPNSVTSIGGCAFGGCSALTSVTIPNSITIIDDGTFMGCSNLSNLTIGNSVTSIGGGAFWGCSSLTSVTIPYSVTIIADCAFVDCISLSSVTIGNNVTSIGTEAFGYYYESSIQKVPGFTIYGCVGSAAEAYANENGFLFQVQHVVKSDPNEDRDFTFNTGEEIEDLVFSTASTEYNPRLAHFLSVMARAAYNEDQIKNNYQQLGFSDTIPYHYDYGDPFAAFLIGKRRLDDGSLLVMITIRGTSDPFKLFNFDYDYGNEWTDINFSKYLIENEIEPSVGLHEGFYRCVTMLYGTLMNYFDYNLPTQNVTYVITGHSLGGAVGNLLSLKLFKNGVPNYSLYNYNFGCPLVGAGSGDHGVWNYNGIHSNIINICNRFDFVPSRPNEGDYDIFTLWDYGAKSWTDFKRFGVSYWFDNGWANTLDAHNMCAYIDYLARELDESHFISKEYYYNTLSAHCPVDVVVFDRNGNPIAGVSGNEPNYYGYEEGEKALVFTDGDSKEIWVLNDDQIDVHLSATDEGEMEYLCFQRELTSGNTSGKKYYGSVNLTEGKRMASTFGGEITADEAKLIVLDEDDNAVAEILEDGTEIVLQSGSDCYLNPFTDVKEGKYFFIPVLWACYHDPQITSGTSDTTFGPNETCTRAQIVTFLWRAAGSPEPTTSDNPFADVKTSKYYYKAVLWATEQGITSGTSETMFSPNAGCTRAQVVTFLWRFAGSPEPTPTTNPFEDVKTGKYYYKAVLWAAENNVTAGTSETTFSPNDTCTRGQIVTFLYRYVVR